MSEYLSACFASKREQLADADARNVGRNRVVQRAAVVVARLGLRIERVEVRRPAGQPDLNHRLGLGLRRRRGGAGGDGRPGGHEQPGRAGKAAAKRLAAGEPGVDPAGQLFGTHAIISVQGRELGVRS